MTNKTILLIIGLPIYNADFEISIQSSYYNT